MSGSFKEADRDSDRRDLVVGKPKAYKLESVASAVSMGSHMRPPATLIAFFLQNPVAVTLTEVMMARAMRLAAVPIWCAARGPLTSTLS